MMIFFNSRYLLKLGRKEVGPVLSGNNRATIHPGDQLGMVALSGAVDYLCDGLQAAHLRSPVLAFEKSKAPVR